MKSEWELCLGLGLRFRLGSARTFAEVRHFSHDKNTRLLNSICDFRFPNQHKSQSVLKITNSKVRDSGIYTCRVNVSGHVLESKATVLVSKVRKKLNCKIIYLSDKIIFYASVKASLSSLQTFFGWDLGLFDVF